MKEVIIKTESLKKNYASDQGSVPVIHNLDFEIYRGEFTMIMGNSGSGKSTLLYLLSGLDTVSGGKIWINEQTVQDKNESALALMRRKHIGFVFQEHNLIPNLSLRENILVAGYLSAHNKKIVQQRTNFLLDELELRALANRLPSQVSGGEQQRCAIARALINVPTILMADEPTGNLNSAASEKALNCLKKINENGQTIVMVTHDLKAACYGDKVLFFKDGGMPGTFEFTKDQPQAERESSLFTWLKQMGW